MNPPITNDRRSDEDKANTLGFVIATDTFLSGWGLAPNRSFYAVPFSDSHEATIIKANMRLREEMESIRVLTADYPDVELKRGDHLSIPGFSETSRYRKPPHDGGFASD